jgi:hypothetical protein
MYIDVDQERGSNKKQKNTLDTVEANERVLLATRPAQQIGQREYDSECIGTFLTD